MPEAPIPDGVEKDRPETDVATAPLPHDTAILIVAPNASTKFGGEAVLPVHYFRVLKARGYPVTLLAHVRNQPSLEESFGPNNPDIQYIENTIWHRLLAKAGRPFPGKIRHFAFGMAMNLVNERYQAKRIRTLKSQGKVDLIHQPIPVSPKVPSSIHGFDVPVVIGPMNGGMDLPEGYEDLTRASERRFEKAARAMAKLANRLLPGKARAAALVVANSRTRRALAVDHPNIVTLAENGVDLEMFSAGRKATPSVAGTIRLVYVGRLVDWKAVDVTLQAVARARLAGIEATIDIVGSGPEQRKLETLAAQLDIEDAATFHGFMKQEQCADILRQADALMLNSVFECGGAVVLEAMSIGLPVIAPDWGGPADYVRAEETGLLVHPSPRSDFADRLAQAIAVLAADPKARVEMGDAGADLIRAEFDWERKVDRMLEIYADALDRAA